MSDIGWKNIKLTYSKNSKLNKATPGASIILLGPPDDKLYKKLKVGMRKESALIRKMIQDWIPVKVDQWVGYMGSNHIYLVCVSKR